MTSLYFSRAMRGLLDLDTASLRPGEPVHDVAWIVTAEFVLRAGHDNVDPGAGQRRFDRGSDGLPEGQRRLCPDENLAAVEPMERHRVGVVA